jgi:Mg-chelatase subunit ChlD
MTGLLSRALAPALVVASCILSSVSAQAKPAVEVAFVLDTTGSMAALIEGAKRKIWSIATTIIDENPDAEIRMGLIAYRDIGDEYVTQRIELTADIQDLYARLLEFRARGGGDWPESVNEALHEGITKLSWTQGPEVSRIVFLVGDAPPHMDYAQDVKFPETLKVARERGIVVNAVQAGEARDTMRFWREIAQRGDGEYIPIPQDGGKLLVIETPFDVEIIELQRQLNGTVIPYGPRTKRSSVEQKTRQVTSVAAASPSSAADMAGYLNKRARKAKAGEAITGDGDLVADVGAGRKALSTVKEDELPDTLRAMKPEQRHAAIEKNAAERKALSERMTGLVKQRDEFLATQQKTQPARTADSFDRAVQSTLKAQIKR